MAVPEKLKTLVEQLPAADGRGMYTEGIDKEKIENTVAAIAKGGPDFVQGLVDMLGEPGSEGNVKPHYGLHCVVNYRLTVGDETMRRRFCEVLAVNLDGELSTFNKAYLCQELQWAGRGEAVAALGKLLADEKLCEPAAMALTAIRGAAADTLRKALLRAEGPCRLTLLHALAALADQPSAATFRQSLGDDDREIRLVAGSGIANIADAGAVDDLLKAADVEPGWERIQQTKHCLVLAENLVAAGKQKEAGRIYAHLRSTRRDASEKYIRDACEAALAKA